MVELHFSTFSFLFDDVIVLVKKRSGNFVGIYSKFTAKKVDNVFPPTHPFSGCVDFGFVFVTCVEVGVRARWRGAPRYYLF